MKFFYHVIIATTLHIKASDQYQSSNTEYISTRNYIWHLPQDGVADFSIAVDVGVKPNPVSPCIHQLNFRGFLRVVVWKSHDEVEETSIIWCVEFSNS